MQHSKSSIAMKFAASALLTASVLCPAVALAQQASNSERAAIEIITIQHRDPQFVSARLRSSLDPRGNIGLVDNKLIIASTAGNLQQLKNLIADVDVPPRRLVVSVDFEFGGSRPGNANQQSLQALEGEDVSFTDGVSNDPQPVSDIPTPLPEPLSLSLAETQPRLALSSVIRGDYAEAEVEIISVPGFSGSYSLSLPLGEWYVINPLLEHDDDSAIDSGFENSDVVSEPVPAINSEPLPVVAPIAVRVDVLP